MLESNGGTWSCSFANSSAISGASRSRRVDNICPNLTKIGPNCSNAQRIRTPREASKTRPRRISSSKRAAQRYLRCESAISSSPKRQTTRLIVHKRNRHFICARLLSQDTRFVFQAAPSHRATGQLPLQNLQMRMHRANAVFLRAHTRHPIEIKPASWTEGIAATGARPALRTARVSLPNPDVDTRRAWQALLQTRRPLRFWPVSSPPSCRRLQHQTALRRVRSSKPREGLHFCRPARLQCTRLPAPSMQMQTAVRKNMRRCRHAEQAHRAPMFRVPATHLAHVSVRLPLARAE